ncbi:MAG: hypothetical protein LBG59_08855, partial [Candidatus Peribacteria bacterium]|nr:hypothetical protein [Candidatus Peribacteria bacterium]
MNTLASSPETVLSAVHTTTFETWIPFYAQRNDIYIDIDDSLEGVAAVPDTTQGEKLRIIINPRLCMEQYNFTPSEFLVVLFHRIEHLFEDAQLRASPEGEEVIKKREQRQQEQGIRASSYHELENVLRDMYVNE